MSRSVVRSARLMMSTSGPQAADRRGLVRLEHRGQPALEVGLDLLDDLGRGAVHDRDAVGDVGLDGSGRPARTSAACLAVMCASTSAIVCGCSSWRNDSTMRGSARRRNSNGISTHGLEPGQDLARPCPGRGWPRAAPGRTRGRPGRVVARGRELAGTRRAPRSATSASIVLQPGDLGGERLDLGLAQGLQHLGRALLAELDEQDRGLAQPGHLAGRSWSWSAASGPRASRAAAGRPRRAGARPAGRSRCAPAGSTRRARWPAPAAARVRWSPTSPPWPSGARLEGRGLVAVDGQLAEVDGRALPPCGCAGPPRKQGERDEHDQPAGLGHVEQVGALLVGGGGVAAPSWRRPRPGCRTASLLTVTVSPRLGSRPAAEVTSLVTSASLTLPATSWSRTTATVSLLTCARGLGRRGLERADGVGAVVGLLDVGVVPAVRGAARHGVLSGPSTPPTGVPRALVGLLGDGVGQRRVLRVRDVLLVVDLGLVEVERRRRPGRRRARGRRRCRACSARWSWCRPRTDCACWAWASFGAETPLPPPAAAPGRCVSATVTWSAVSLGRWRTTRCTIACDLRRLER